MSTIRGLVGNTVGLGLLGAVGYGLDLGEYCTLATGVQYAVYLLHGLPQRSEKYYDLSGSATHLALVFLSLLRSKGSLNARQVFCTLASTVWLTRLGSFLFLRISRDGRDDRFEKIKTNALNFLSAWTIQALWVTLTQAPTLLANKEGDEAKPVGAIDALAAVGWTIGLAMEVAADVQKFVFRCDPKNKDKFITSGLWRYSRHPNYFGEILMWVSLAVSVSTSAASAKARWGAWLSPAITTMLLVGLSGIPMVEKLGMKKWGQNPDYLHYVKNTSVLFPWFPAPDRKD